MMNGATKQPWIYREMDSSLGCLKWFLHYRISIHQCLTGCQFTNAGSESLFFCAHFHEWFFWTTSFFFVQLLVFYSHHLFMVIMDQKLKLKVCSSLYFARTMWPFHCICTTMPRPQFFTLKHPNMPCKTSSNMNWTTRAMHQNTLKKHDRILNSGISGFQWWLETFGLRRLHFPASLALRVCNDELPWLEVPCSFGRLVEPKKSPEFFFLGLFFWVLSKRCHRISQQFSNAFEETHEPLLLRWFSLWCIQSSIRSDHTTWWSQLF